MVTTIKSSYCQHTKSLLLLITSPMLYLLATYFVTGSLYLLIPYLFHPFPPPYLPSVDHQFVLRICESGFMFHLLFYIFRFHI